MKRLVEGVDVPPVRGAAELRFGLVVCLQLPLSLLLIFGASWRLRIGLYVLGVLVLWALLSFGLWRSILAERREGSNAVAGSPTSELVALQSGLLPGVAIDWKEVLSLESASGEPAAVSCAAVGLIRGRRAHTAVAVEHIDDDDGEPHCAIHLVGFAPSGLVVETTAMSVFVGARDRAFHYWVSATPLELLIWHEEHTAGADRADDLLLEATARSLVDSSALDNIHIRHVLAWPLHAIRNKRCLPPHGPVAAQERSLSA